MEIKTDKGSTLTDIENEISDTWEEWLNGQLPMWYAEKMFRSLGVTGKDIINMPEYNFDLDGTLADNLGVK